MDEKNCGTIGRKTVIAIEALLKNQSQGRFGRHRTMKGVSMKKINCRHIPLEIMQRIRACGKSVKSFFIIKANRPIPVHLHDKAGEMYLGGDGGMVTLQNPAQNQVNHVMRMNVFTVVDTGGFHGVNLYSPIKEIIFLGIKFNEEMS